MVSMREDVNDLISYLEDLIDATKILPTIFHMWHELAKNL